MAAETAKLKVAGAWSGVIEVELGGWTVPMLRDEVAKRSGCDGPHLINLIFAGRVLRDGDGNQNLAQLGLKNNAKILATRVSADAGKVKEEFLAEEERSNRLSRLKAAATSLAQRHADGSLPVEDFNLELENQSGEKVEIGSETDQRAIMMGLMLHTNAKQLTKQQQFADALEVLTMGEEAFSLCDPKAIEMVDNVSILQIDMVWCYFMLRDIRWLSVAGVRLKKAREGLERAYGKEASRMRLLQGGKYPELVLHLRLELLEGVIAYHSGLVEKSRKALTAAQLKYFQLQVSDESLSLMMSMGYNEREVKRALRMSNQDIERAIEFIIDEKVKKAQKMKDDKQRQKDIFEQKRFGMTPLGKSVDLKKLNYLVSIGYERKLVAEALRRNENETQKTLDDLTNPETNCAIQRDLELANRKRLRQAADFAIQNLESMGFSRELATDAVQRFGTKGKALDFLTGNISEVAAPVSGGDGGGSGGGDTGDVNLTSSNADTSMVNEDSNADAAGPSNERKVVERDVEMEDQLTYGLQETDAYSDYDIEVTKEGEAIAEYLALLDSAADVNNTSVEVKSA